MLIQQRTWRGDGEHDLHQSHHHPCHRRQQQRQVIHMAGWSWLNVCQDIPRPSAGCQPSTRRRRKKTAHRETNQNKEGIARSIESLLEAATMLSVHSCPRPEGRGPRPWQMQRSRCVRLSNQVADWAGWKTMIWKMMWPQWEEKHGWRK